MSDAVEPGLLDRAIRRITTVWRDMASSVAGEPDEPLESQMRACLHGRGGEVSARNRAAKLAQTYQGLDEAGRKHFLRTLASFDSDADAVTHAYDDVQKAIDPADRAVATAELRQALEPPRLKLLTQFTSIPDGRKFLVDLRAFLLKIRKDDRLLAALEAICAGCCRRGSTSASWSWSASTGTAPRRCWRSWSIMRRCMPSAPGAT